MLEYETKFENNIYFGSQNKILEKKIFLKRSETEPKNPLWQDKIFLNKLNGIYRFSWKFKG
jgi:hypothetical protein